ncbi:hypothetical protein RugamoR57_39800 [Duganella caerulea]|uniref:DUF1800 domain-containing protein n=1 Tax=Duganella caerulea TaxID=2885762 RepID=UPI0030E88A82
MKLSHLKLTVGVAILATLGACGGGTGPTAQGGSKDQTKATVQTSDASGATTSAISSLAGTVQRMFLSGTATASGPISQEEASRFLQQATFGPTMANIQEVSASGPEAWIDNQFTLPQSLHRNYMEWVQSRLPAGTTLNRTQFLESFWRQAASGDDQLRQRMAFALSQILVVSMSDSEVASMPRGAAAYYDILATHCFTNFRTLLSSVAQNPIMGTYLSHIHNQKESGYRVPDENFAREIMQLMSIGLYQLNQDGSKKLNNGVPIETYTHDDVAGLAKVFTGMSFYGPDTSAARFWGDIKDVDYDWRPMQGYAAYHSTSTKKFLGVTISGNTTAYSDFNLAIDTLFNHPNVGPFIGRQLIQRLVTSNPSPAYVSRVAAVFANNGSGVRGDMKALIKAILLDPEARAPATSGQGKLREPVLRLAHWMRSFEAHSYSGRYLMYSLDDPLKGIGQTPMRSPSVFNFFRPAYVPPNTLIAAAGLVAPEMQITAEPSVAGYLNFMVDAIPWGVGTNRDIKPTYVNEIPLAVTPDLLVDRINLLMMAGSMSSTLRNQIISAVNMVARPLPTATNSSTLAAIDRNRVSLAIFLTMASPEYLIQK